MRYGFMIFHLRALKNLTQAEVASLAKGRWTQPQISQLEAREFAPRGSAIRRVERVLAYGEPRKGETEPLYCLVKIDQFPDFLSDEQLRLGVYRNRDAALFALD